jgi:hypothetical protein
MAKFKTVEIDGRKFDVELDGDGHFSALDDGDLVKAETFSALQEKLRTRRRRQKVRLSLPITLLGVTQAPDPAVVKHSWQRTPMLREAPETVDATVTGLHAQNRDLLVVMADGTKDRMDGNGYGREGIIARRLTAAEKATYVRLATAADAADAALKTFVDGVKISNARNWVREQVEAAEKAQLDAEPAVEETPADPRLAAPRRRR